MKTQVNVHEAKTHLSQLLEQVEKGEQIIIARAGKPIAIMSAFPGKKIVRKPGAWKGKIWMADDFDELPGDIAAAFRGERP